MTELLASLGLKLSTVVAGLSGGIASLVMPDKEGREKLGKVKAFGLIFLGGAFAAYLTDPIVSYLGLSDKAENGVAFIVGLSSMRLLQAFLGFLDKHKDDPLGVWKKWRKGHGYRDTPSDK